MVKIVCKGSYKKSFKYFKKLQQVSDLRFLNKYGEEGVAALREATPKKSGLTADSWTYTIERSRDQITISWDNTNIVDGANIAILLQFGHGTGTGGYVRGTDYINPAIKPVFDKIAEAAWEEVTKL